MPGDALLYSWFITSAQGPTQQRFVFVAKTSAPLSTTAFNETAIDVDLTSDVFGSGIGAGKAAVMKQGNFVAADRLLNRQVWTF